jgi:hypothetical protein
MNQHRAALGVRRPAALATVICALGGIALAALAAGPGPAGAGSERVELTYSGARTSSAPSGTSSIHISEGDSIVLAVGAAPTRASANLLGYSITVHMSSFPSGSSSVTLKGSQTYTAHFDSPGNYSFSWTGANKLGDIKPRSGERTSATVEVAAAPTPPAGSSDPPVQLTDPATPGTTGSGADTPAGSGASSTLNPPIGFSGGPGSGPNAAQLPVSLPTFGGPGGSLGGPATAGAGGLQQDVAVGGLPVAGAADGGGPDPANPEFVADPHSAAPPRALAVISIGSLGAVAACYAYLYLGGRGARPQRVRLPL